MGNLINRRHRIEDMEGKNTFIIGLKKIQLE